MREIDREYAQALFALSLEEERAEGCYEDMALVEKMLEENAGYLPFLASPAIPLSERLDALEEAFGGSVSESSLSFLKLLCEKGRIGLFFNCMEEYRGLYRSYQGRCTARITSASALSSKQKERLLEKLEKVTKRKIDPVYTVTPHLLGGVTVEVDGKVYDGSLKSRLRDLKEVMMDEQT